MAASWYQSRVPEEVSEFEFDEANALPGWAEGYSCADAPSAIA